jgi:hypothetical protein
VWLVLERVVYAAAAGLPEIDLHDVRHSYATPGRDAKIDGKALSKRIGHADVAFTMKQYVQTDLEADRQVATTLAELIVGGSLVPSRSVQARTRRDQALVHKSVHKPYAKGPLSVREGASGPGSGGGI